MTDVGKPYSGGRTGNAGFGRPRTPELDARYDKKQRDSIRRQKMKAKRDARLERIRAARKF